MDLGITVKDVLGFTAAWLYAFWPIVVLAPLIARRSRSGSPLPAMLAAWALAAVAGLVSMLSSLPKVALIPEPLNSLLFVAAGLSLIAVYLWSRRRRSKD